jgi:PAS domain S-box-containing protein
MSIVKKTILIVCLTSLVLLVLMYFISDYFYLKGFEELEKQTVERNVQRINETVSARLDALSTYCYDWAAWDDTYNFAREYNQEYVDRNLQNETFSYSEVNIIAILDKSGNIVFSKAYDFANNRGMDFPNDFTKVIVEQKLIDPLNVTDGTSGIVLVTGQPVLIVSRQILNSLAEGPSTGTIIMGRFLDAEILNSLASITSFPVQITSISDINSDPALKSVAAALNGPNPVYVQVQNKKLITGYTYVKDIIGNPIFIFKVDRYRDIYNQGLNVIGIWHVSILLVCICFGFVLFLLLRKILLSRLTTLNESVNTIGSSIDLSIRVPVTGNDELSMLTSNINTMLDSLAKSETRLRSQKEVIGYIIDNTPNAVLATNENGHIVLVNKAFSEMFGLKASDIYGQAYNTVAQLGNLIPETKVFLDSGSQRTSKNIQYVYNGNKKSFIVNFARLNEEKMFFIILTDITEEQARQERLHLTHRLASVGEMASGIAHELNNPLTGIIGLSELLVDEDISDTIKDDISAINSEAKRAAVVVKNMLSFARKHSPSKQLTQINTILEDVLALRRHEHKNHNIQVVAALAKDLPEITADPYQIQQVFINIVLNAEQAMVEAHGKGTLTISSMKAGDKIRVTFTDDGPGIDRENMHRIFDPFFTTKEVGKGTGLGLSICYGIITAHDGLIYAKNENGKGATFIIELPINTVKTE